MLGDDEPANTCDAVSEECAQSLQNLGIHLLNLKSKYRMFGPNRLLFRYRNGNIKGPGWYDVIRIDEPNMAVYCSTVWMLRIEPAHRDEMQRFLMMAQGARNRNCYGQFVLHTPTGELHYKIKTLVPRVVLSPDDLLEACGPANAMMLCYLQGLMKVAWGGSANEALTACPRYDRESDLDYLSWHTYLYDGIDPFAL